MKVLIPIVIGLLVVGCGKKSVEPVAKRGQKTVTQNEGPLTSKSQVDAETTERLETKKKKSALEKAGYKGRVKSVKLVGPHLVQISKFDKKGNLIENTIGSDIKAIYNYDNNGNLAEMVFSEKGEVTETRDYDYDGKGNQVQMVVRDGSGEITEKHIFKYDVDGNKVERVQYNKGKFFRKYTFKYDNKGNEIEMLHEKSNGDITSRNTTLYDRKGNEVARIGYLPSGKILVKITFRYDVKGNKIEMTRHDINGKVFSNHIFKYDAKGDLIERVIGGIGGYSKISYKNDKMSNPVKAETHKSWDGGKTWSDPPSVESWEYVYWD